MNNKAPLESPMTVNQFTDATIRIALVAILVVAALRVFSPFMDLMIWALILAVTIYPAHQGLSARLGGKEGRAATLIVLLGIMILGMPIALLGASLAEGVADVLTRYRDGSLTVSPPAASVAEWPLVGQEVFDAWTAAAANLQEFIEENRTSLESLASKAMAMAKGTVGTVLLFIGALIVSGILMAFGRGGSQATGHILSRIAGEEQGPKVHTLITMTTRSVAAGVLGVALVQSILFGVGFMLAGVPAAGLLAGVVLILAIVQLPAMLVSVPVILWVWNGGDSGTVMNVVWTVYFLLAGLADNILKPMLLGRGVDAPMPVILIGALGGLVSSGFVGLFTGAVVLAVAYQIFMHWVAFKNAEEDAERGGENTGAAE